MFFKFLSVSWGSQGKAKSSDLYKDINLYMLSKTITGSSETIRKTTFNFLNYRSRLVSHKKPGNIKTAFLEWFVGFSEGDGSFITSKARLFFIISQKEEKILHHIRTELGFGKVSNYKAYSRFIVADRDNIERLIHIFNGNLVLNKTRRRFCSWVEAWNLWCSQSPCQQGRRVDLLSQNQLSSLGDNAWLCGFTDAEGCFAATQTRDPRYSLGWRLRLRFILDQKSERELLERVKLFLNSGVVYRRKEVDHMWRFSSTSIAGHQTAVAYFTRHPLRTIKRVSFLRFASLFRYMINRPSLPWKGKVLMRVENLIKNINKTELKKVVSMKSMVALPQLLQTMEKDSMLTN